MAYEYMHVNRLDTKNYTKHCCFYIFYMYDYTEIRNFFYELNIQEGTRACFSARGCGRKKIQQNNQVGQIFLHIRENRES